MLHRDEQLAAWEALTADLLYQLAIARAERDEARNSLRLCAGQPLPVALAPDATAVTRRWPCKRCGSLFERVGREWVCSECTRTRMNTSNRAYNQRLRDGRKAHRLLRDATSVTEET